MERSDELDKMDKIKLEHLHLHQLSYIDFYNIEARIHFNAFPRSYHIAVVIVVVPVSQVGIRDNDQDV